MYVTLSLFPFTLYTNRFPSSTVSGFISFCVYLWWRAEKCPGDYFQENEKQWETAGSREIKRFIVLSNPSL